jgi:O-antigen/teichoic acid export membrane protein
VLTLGGMLMPFTFIFSELFIAKERPAFFLGLEVVKGVLLFLFIFLFFPKGIMGLAVSWVVYMVITLLISVFFSGKVIHYSLPRFVRDTFPYLFTALLSAVATYFVTRNLGEGLLFIVASVAVTGVLYIAMCKLLGLEMTKEIDAWLNAKKENKDVE